MTRRILLPGESYSFSRYFEMPFTLDDILLDLDCTIDRTKLNLPYVQNLPDLALLRKQLVRNRKRMRLENETARREAFVSPVLLEVCEVADRQLQTEYAIAVNDYLKGNLDYYIGSSRLPEQELGLLVVEAKQSDLVRGFTQLAIELIALDQWTRSKTPLLYGAVTTGEVWQFGAYHREGKQILADQEQYELFNDLDRLVGVLLGILQ
jgi:hypothetical protein